jgi:hypothetical protein
VRAALLIDGIEFLPIDSYAHMVAVGTAALASGYRELD